MRVPKLIKARQRRRHGRHRRGRPAAPGRWQLAGAGAAVITLAALAAASLPASPMAGGYDDTAAGVVESPEVDPFIEDETLAEFVAPEQLAAVPVGPGRVAKPVQMVLSGAPVIKTLGESGIPEVAVRAYKQAEARLAASDPGCGVPWTLLAAIGRVESNHGRFGGAQLRDDGSATRRIRGIPLDGRPNVAVIRDSDNGALDGDTVYDRAVGPMQFIPSTWRSVNADGNGDGVGDPNNMFDAALGAAQYLCTGTSNLRNPAGAAQAVRRYNNADSYVRVVLELARMYQTGGVVGLPSTGDSLPDEPTDQLADQPAGPPALRPWPADPSPVRPWPAGPSPVRPWPAGPSSDTTVLAKPAPSQRVSPAPPRATAPAPKPAAPPAAAVVPDPATTSKPPVAQPPRPTTRPTPADPQPTQTRPSTPKPPSPKPSTPETTRPPVPKPSEPSAPEPSEPEPTKPSAPEPSEPTPSKPRPSEPKPSESDSPTPSAEPTPERKPTTAAVGWAPAMRQVVGRTLNRPTCAQPTTPTPQQAQPSKACPDDATAPDDKNRDDNNRSDKPRGDRDDKKRDRCTSQNVCKAPGSPRTPARSTR
jgi:membrane-bound lytic murein transglycosylase B